MIQIISFILTHSRVVKLFFDILHGLTVNDVPLITAIEFAILLGFDGQLKQGSVLEMELFTSIIEQMKKTQMTKIENALMWLYVKSWSRFGQHLIDERSLWNFGGEDLEAALTAITYARQKGTTELTKALKTLIMERFDNEIAFVKWSQGIHSEVIENIPLTVEAIQCNLDQIDVNDKSTPASMIGFRASNIQRTSENKYEQAPVRGIYSFLATTHVKENQTWFIDLVCYANNNHLADSKAIKRPENERTVTLQAVVQLNKNDKVKLEGKMLFFHRNNVVAYQSFYEGRLVYSTVE